MPEGLKRYFLNIDKEGNFKVPHITTSLSNKGKAVNTANLNFKNLEKPIIIKGRLGVFVKEENKGYISFDKIKHNKKDSMSIL